MLYLVYLAVDVHVFGNKKLLCNLLEGLFGNLILELQ